MCYSLSGLMYRNEGNSALDIVPESNTPCHYVHHQSFCFSITCLSNGILRTLATLGNLPGDVLSRVLDIACLAMDTAANNVSIERYYCAW